MYGILMPRPGMLLKPSPSWQTTFNSAILSSSKIGTIHGYSRVAPTGGSIVDGTIDILSGALINGLESGIGFALKVNGSLPNSGWEYLFINDAVLLRADATYGVQGSPAYTNWSWLGGAGFGQTQSNILLGMA